jgi:hypothetical protein
MHGNIRLNFRPTRKELAMATMRRPKKEQADEVFIISQKRPPLERFRVQVDRQTKASFKDKGEAEKAGTAIKQAHPKVQVSILDADESSTTVLMVDS